MKHAAAAAGWIATLALGVLLGLLAARFRLFDSPWAVAALALLVGVLIVTGVRAYRHLWDEDE